MDIASAKGIFVGGASGMCRATAEQFKAKGGAVMMKKAKGGVVKNPRKMTKGGTVRRMQNGGVAMKPRKKSKGTSVAKVKVTSRVRNA